MSKGERATLIRQKARELARTGEYSGWLIIEQMLRHQHGFPEARSVLDEHFIRRELDALCETAREQRGETDAQGATR